MSKFIFFVFIYTILFFPVFLLSREFRTPLLTHKDTMYSSFFINVEKNDWIVDIWSQGYTRKASEGFKDSDHKKCSLSQLIFGKIDFQAQEAFANSSAISPLNPFLLSTLSPRIKYTDRGVIFGIHALKPINQKWNIGVRTHIPFRNFSMKLIKKCNSGSSLLGGENIEDVVQKQKELFNGTEIETFAYRLDFLAQLSADCKEPGIQIPLVNFAHASFPNNVITIRNLDVTEQNIGDQNPISIIHRDDGSVPIQGFGITKTAVLLLPALSEEGKEGNGNILGNNDRARFVFTNNYTSLGQDSATQKQLWVVPSVQITPTVQLVNNAVKIRDVVNELLGCVNRSAEELFEQYGLMFCKQKNRGIGDLDTAIFIQRTFDTNGMLETIFGIRFPTAEKIYQAGKLFLQPLGNNGHTELMFGLRGIWEPSNWICFSANSSYSFVLRKREFMPASFIGAQVKNLGPIVPANIAWGYFIGNIDAKLSIPVLHKQHDLGFNVGYRLYVKQKDSIRFNIPAVSDYIGVIQNLDATVAVKNTNVMAHTLYNEFSYYYRKSQHYCAGVFTGLNLVVAGKNTPCEYGGHFGIHIWL